MKRQKSVEDSLPAEQKSLFHQFFPEISVPKRQLDDSLILQIDQLSKKVQQSEAEYEAFKREYSKRIVLRDSEVENLRQELVVKSKIVEQEKEKVKKMESEKEDLQIEKFSLEEKFKFQENQIEAWKHHIGEYESLYNDLQNIVQRCPNCSKWMIIASASKTAHVCKK